MLRSSENHEILWVLLGKTPIKTVNLYEDAQIRAYVYSVLMTYPMDSGHGTTNVNRQKWRSLAKALCVLGTKRTK